jgi:hypothetical protein
VQDRFSAKQFADSMNALYADVLGSRRRQRPIRTQAARAAGGS